MQIEKHGHEHYPDNDQSHYKMSVCGFNQWLGNHYIYDGNQEKFQYKIYLDRYSYAASTNNCYQFWSHSDKEENDKEHNQFTPQKGPKMQLIVTDPTGFAAKYRGRAVKHP